HAVAATAVMRTTDDDGDHAGAVGRAGERVAHPRVELAPVIRGDPLVPAGREGILRIGVLPRVPRHDGRAVAVGVPRPGRDGEAGVRRQLDELHDAALVAAGARTAAGGQHGPRAVAAAVLDARFLVAVEVAGVVPAVPAV